MAKAVRPVHKRELVNKICCEWDVSIRRACHLIGIAKRVARYQPRRPYDSNCDSGCVNSLSWVTNLFS